MLSEKMNQRVMTNLNPEFNSAVVGKQLNRHLGRECPHKRPPDSCRTFREPPIIFRISHRTLVNLLGPVLKHKLPLLPIIKHYTLPENRLEPCQRLTPDRDRLLQHD